MAKEVRKTIGIFVNGKEVENNLKSIRAAIAKVSNELNKMTVGTDEYNAHAAKLSQLKKIYDDYKEELKDVREELEAGEKAQESFILKAGARASVISTASNALRKFVSSTQEYVEAYASIDKAMQDVAKASGLSREEIEQMNLALKDIDTTASNEELLKIAEIGGHLNLSKEELTRFTQATDQAMKTFGITAEEAADAFSRLRRTFKDAAKGDIADTIYSIGSSINALDSVGTVTEKNIMLFAEEIGKLPDYIKPSIQDVLALGGAFETAGIDAQTAASGYMRIMNTATQNIDKFTGVMKMSAEELKNLIKSNPAEFVLKLGESLKALPEDQIGEALKSMGLGSARLSATMGALIRNTDQFRKSLDLSNKEYKKATAMTDEFNKLSNTSSAQLEKARKRMQEARVELGKKLIPIITELYEIAGTVSGWLVKNIKIVTLVASGIAGLVSVLGMAYIKEKALLAVEKAKNAVDAIQKSLIATKTVAIQAHNLVLAKQTKNTIAAANAQKALNVAMKSTPWGIIITAIAAAAAAIAAFVKKTNEAAETQKDLNSEIEIQYNQEKKKIEDLVAILDNENSSREQKLRAISTLKEIIPGYVAELDKEGKVVNNNRKAIDDYLKSLKKKITYENLQKAYNESQTNLVRAESNLEFETDQRKNGTLLGALWDDVFKARTNSLVQAQKEVEKEKKLSQDLLKKMEEMDLELISETGKNYNETYGFNENILNDFGTTGLEGGNTGNGSSSSSTKKTVADFDKELAAFRKRQQSATLGEWERTKNGIIEGYEELIKKAKSLGKDDAFLTALGIERDDAVTAAGQKYLQKYTLMLTNMKQETEKLLAENGDDEMSELQKAVIGTEKQWDDKISVLKTNMATIADILQQLPDDDPVRTQMTNIYDGMMDDLTKLTAGKAQATSNVIKKYAKQTSTFIQNERKELERSQMTELEREKAEINERYQVEIDRISEAIVAKNELLFDGDGDEALILQSENREEIERLMQKLEELIKLRDKLLDNVGKNKKSSKGLWNDLLNIDWKNFKDNWQENLDLMTRALQEFANAALDILNSINQIQANREQAELDQFIATQDEKSKALQRQLDDGLISQKYYDAQMAKMEKEKEAKEKKIQHDQFERERKANLAKVLIEGGLAVATAFAQYGWPWGLIPAALSTAMTAAQTAMIASQVNPYAKGGYIRKEQIALMGEEGQEWVASNKLLKDKKTAPVIAALQAYQSGNSRALEALALSQPDWNGLSQSAKNISTTFAGSNAPVVNNYNSSTDNSEVLKELKQMNAYLKDPKNRQAYISRKMQLEFDRQENELKAMARL